MANDFEKIAEELGLNISSEPPKELVETPKSEQSDESSDVLENTEPDGEPQPEDSTTETAPQGDGESEDDKVEDDAVVEPTGEDEQNTPEEPEEVDHLSAISEMLGTKYETIEDLKGALQKEQPKEVELDPTVKAIADFMQETGRPATDWFKYQSFNPTEMGDLEVVKYQLKSQYPNLSEEDAQLLVATRYKLDADEFSENEVRIGKLNLQMDAQNARGEMTKLKESFKAPLPKDPEPNQEPESPITEEWVSAMSKTVDEIESLELEIGKDKNFSFNLDKDYKTTLKSKNAKLDEYFDQYVDSNTGNWDFNKLSAHRAIVDNIDSIAKAVYAQGLADGQSKVVKTAVNPSSPTPQSGGGTDAASAEERVRQQVLNALQGGDDTLSIKF